MLNASALVAHFGVAEVAQTVAEWTLRGRNLGVPNWVFDLAEDTISVLLLIATARLIWAAVPVLSALFALMAKSLDRVHASGNSLKLAAHERLKEIVRNILKRSLEKLSQKPKPRSRRKLR